MNRIKFFAAAAMAISTQSAWAQDAAPPAAAPAATTTPAFAAPPAAAATVYGAAAPVPAAPPVAPPATVDIVGPAGLPGVGPGPAVIVAPTPAFTPLAAPATVRLFKSAPWEQAAADPETAKLMGLDREKSDEIQVLAAKFKNLTDANERATAETELAELVTKQFMIRQQMREVQLAQLEEQVKRLRTTQTEREAQRDRIISDRVQQILRDAAGLGWGDVGAEGAAAAKFDWVTKADWVGGRAGTKEGKVVIRRTKEVDERGVIEPPPGSESTPRPSAATGF
jgi:hypothetical protein